MRIADNAGGRDVSVGTVVEPVSESLKPAIAHLWQLFSYDLSEFRGRPPDADGTYPMHGLPTFFVGDPARRAYVIRHNAVLAGFATVATDVGGLQHLDSFFVIRPLRRQRIGYRAAHELPNTAAGVWEIGFQEENPGAARFWRTLARDLVRARPGSHWREEARPVPGKPWLPDDRFVLLELRGEPRPPQ